MLVFYRPTPAGLLKDSVFESVFHQYKPYQSPVRLFSASPRCAHLELPEDISELCKGLGCSAFTMCAVDLVFST